MKKQQKKRKNVENMPFSRVDRKRKMQRGCGKAGLHDSDVEDGMEQGSKWRGCGADVEQNGAQCGWWGR